MNTNDTDILNKLENLLDDPKEKLNITRNGEFVADIYDLREWIAAQSDPKRIKRKNDPEAFKRRSDAAKARWATIKAQKQAADGPEPEEGVT